MLYYLRPNMIFMLDKILWVKAKNNILKNNFAL